ncbi:MAG: hypothetical protein ACP5KN_00290 [Armatimonadota bacterium]
MTSRERIAPALRHEQADRAAVDGSPRVTAIERWHDEGLTGQMSSAEHLGCEMVAFESDMSARFPAHVLEQDEESIVRAAPIGDLREDDRHYSSVSEAIHWPCDCSDIREKMQQRPELMSRHNPSAGRPPA